MNLYDSYKIRKELDQVLKQNLNDEVYKKSKDYIDNECI